MKKCLAVIAALLLSATVYAQQPVEDDAECDLWARKCLTEKEQLQKAEKELSAQLKEGEKTLSSKEKKRLRLKLEETRRKLEAAQSVQPKSGPPRKGEGGNP
jgi:prephenate dehydrogenase